MDKENKTGFTFSESMIFNTKLKYWICLKHKQNTSTHISDINEYTQ